MRMKMKPIYKLLTLVIMLGASTYNKSNAAGESMFSKGHSTWTVAGVTCSSGTATDITGSLVGFDINAYRLQNQDSSDAVWIGYSSAVSTDTASAYLGEKLNAGDNGVWELGKNPDLAQAVVKIFCKAADAAGAAGVRLSRAIFGSK